VLGKQGTEVTQQPQPWWNATTTGQPPFSETRVTFPHTGALSVQLQFGQWIQQTQHE